MARLWHSGLETGFAFDSVTGSIILSTAQARTGSSSFYIGTGGDGAQYGTITLPSALTEVFVRLCVFRSNSWETGHLLLIQDSAGGSQMSLRYVSRTDYRLYVLLGATTVIGTSTTPIPLNTWCRIEFRLLVNNTTGVAQLKIDGTQEVDFSGDTQATANANLQRLHFGRAGSSSFPLQGYFDDLAINDTGGALNNSWPGSSGILARTPNGAGYYTQLTPSAGLNYECVDEMPPNITDYVSGASANLKDSYIKAPLGTTGVVRAVQFNCYAAQGEAGTSGIASLVRRSGVDYQGADQATAVAWKNYREMLETDPSTAAAWTVAGVDAAEIGVVLR